MHKLNGVELECQNCGIVHQLNSNDCRSTFIHSACLELKKMNTTCNILALKVSSAWVSFCMCVCVCVCDIEITIIIFLNI